MKEDLECLEMEIKAVDFRMQQFVGITPEYNSLQLWKTKLVKAKEALLIKIMEKYE
jgi:hypothetical protein